MPNPESAPTVSAAPPAQVDIFNLYALIDQFLADQINLGPLSQASYRSRLRRFFQWLDSEETTAPTRTTVIAYRRAMESEGLNPTTVSANLVAVRRLFEWLEANVLYHNIARSIRGPRLSHRHRRDCLTREQAMGVLETIDRSTLTGKRDFAMINLMLRTGLRTIEITRADVGDIRQDSDEARLLVHGKGRSEKDDFVVLTEQTLRPIRAYLAARGPVSDTDPLFASCSCRNRLDRLTTRSVRRVVKERFRAIDIDSPRLSAHSLRHTAITFSIRGGATVQDAQAMARHANVNTTMTYFHLANRIDHAGERSVDDWLDEAKAKTGQEE